ncbi:MAG: hypothetical protein AB7V77_00445 [Candidatus Woesearchaeota archaeon]
MNKVGLYFFVLASMLAIIDGSFQTFSVNLQIAKSIVLVFSGVLVGLFLLSEEKDFLIASVSFVIAGSILLNMLGSFFSLSPFGKILSNFILVSAASVVTVGFKEILNTITKASGIEDSIHSEITPEHLDKSSFEILWGIIILVAVAVAILQLLLQTFYDLSNYIAILDMVDLIITALFIVDVIILYEKAESFKKFITKNFFDVLASIPSIGFFRAFKIVRAARIIKIFQTSFRLTRMIKISRTSKFFSENSSFSAYTNNVKNNISIDKSKKSVKKKSVKKKSVKKSKISPKKKNIIKPTKTSKNR